MKKLSRAAAVVALSTGALFAAGQSANASIFYDNNDHGGATYGADNSTWMGSFDNKASSVKNFGYYVTWWQDINYGGAGFGSSNDYSAMGWYVPFLGTWNDNISSFHRG